MCKEPTEEPTEEPTDAPARRRRLGATYVNKRYVRIDIQCFDTKFPTQKPTKSPTFSPTLSPTASPTEACLSIILKGTKVGYDGVYNKFAGTINGFDWWQSRDDVAGVGRNQQVKLYYYKGMEGRRWKLEGPEYAFWSADDTISAEDLKNLLVSDEPNPNRADTQSGPLILMNP